MWEYLITSNGVQFTVALRFASISPDETVLAEAYTSVEDEDSDKPFARLVGVERMAHTGPSRSYSLEVIDPATGRWRCIDQRWQFSMALTVFEEHLHKRARGVPW